MIQVLLEEFQFIIIDTMSLQVACLPMDTITSKVVTSGVVVGWGKTSNSQSIDTLTGAYSAKQQKLEVCCTRTGYSTVRVSGADTRRL